MKSINDAKMGFNKVAFCKKNTLRNDRNDEYDFFEKIGFLNRKLQEIRALVNYEALLEWFQRALVFFS